MSDPDDELEELPRVTPAYAEPRTRPVPLHGREGSFAGQREAQNRAIRRAADDLPGLWDPPSIQKEADQPGPPKTKGILEPDLFESLDQPPVWRKAQSKASYEKELERWWEARMDRSRSDMEVYRQRADALKAKITQAEPANRGPPLDPKDFDFLQSDNPTVIALKKEIAAIERQTSELDVAGGSLKRSDEFRKELKKKKEKDSRPASNWRAALQRFTTFYVIPWMPPLYYMLQMDKAIQWRVRHLLPFMLLPLPLWAQASVAKSRLQPWTKSNENATVELFLASAAGWVPPLVITYAHKQRKVLAFFTTATAALAVGLFTPAMSESALQKQAKAQALRSLTQPGQSLRPPYFEELIAPPRRTWPMAQEMKRCAEAGRVDELRALLDSGVDPNTQYDDGSVALHWACMKADIVRLLLTRNAVADMVTNEESTTPLHWAASAGAILSMGTAPWLPSRVTLVDLLLTIGGADLKQTDARGYTALHHAAQNGQGVAAQFLVKRGIAVDCLDSEGHTPLHWAAYCNQPIVCELLVKLGADLNKQDQEGFTALHWAANRGNWHVANYLVHAGCDRSLKDKEGHTAEDIATKKRNGLVAALISTASHWSGKLRDRPIFWILIGSFGLPLLVQLLASQRSVVAIALLAAVGVASWHFFGRLWGDLQSMQSFWLGLVLGTAAVSLVCYGNYLLPAIRGDMISNLLFIGFLCIGVFSTWQLARSDPGLLPLNQDLLIECQRANEAKKSSPVFCALCLARQPLRARHCDVCQRCTARFSRHITVLGCCVGAKNFILFVSAATTLVLTHVMFLRFCLLAWTRHATNPALFDGMAHVAWPALVHAIWLAYESWHLYGEIVAVSKNLTSFEYAEPRLCDYLYPESSFRNPFDRGNAMENARSFLFGTTDWTRTWSLPVDV